MKENKNLFIGIIFVIILLVVLIYFAFFNNEPDERLNFEVNSFSYTVSGIGDKEIDFNKSKNEQDIKIAIFKDTDISEDVSFEIDVNTKYDISKLVDEELEQKLILRINPNTNNQITYVFNIEFIVDENSFINQVESKYGVAIEYYEDEATKCRDLENCIINKINYTGNMNNNYDEYEIIFDDFRDNKDELILDVCDGSIKCALKIKDKKINNNDIVLNYIMVDTFKNYKLYNIKIGKNNSTVLFNEVYSFIDDINIYGNNLAVVAVEAKPSKSGAPTLDKNLYLFNTSASSIYTLEENDIKLNNNYLTYNEFNDFDERIFDQIVPGFDKDTIIGTKYKLEYNNNTFGNKTKVMDLKKEDI